MPIQFAARPKRAFTGQSPEFGRLRGTGGGESRIDHVRHMCHALHMSKMIQVRNVPDRLHRELTKRAKARGQALTDYIQDLLEREVARPPASEVFDRIEARTPVKLDRPSSELIREERRKREAS